MFGLIYGLAHKFLNRCAIINFLAHYLVNYSTNELPEHHGV